jgi:hypothetical protein
MKRSTTQFSFFVLAVLLVQGAAAQPTKFAQAGMGFLKIDVGSRIAAMGGTHASVSQTALDAFANPAGLAFVEGFDVMAVSTNWIADINHYGLAAAYNAGRYGTIGINLVWMDYGDFRRTVPVDDLVGFQDQGTFSVEEFAVGLSYARTISDQFVVGGNIRLAKQDLGSVTIFDEVQGVNRDVGNSVDNIVLDFGTMYYTGFRDLRFGMSIRNFSNQSDYFNQRFELPLNFDFGVAMDLLQLSATAPENSELTLAVDWQHPRDYEERLHMGLEYGFMGMFFVRTGYKFNYDEEGFAAGLGVNVSLGGAGQLRADYAYSDFGEFFGSVNRITVGFRVGS